MNRNEGNRFAVNPVNLDISRSVFNRNHTVKFSGNVGDVIPFYLDEVLPGDTFSVNTSKVVRMQPLVPQSLFPVPSATRRWLRDRKQYENPEIYSYSKPSHACQPVFSPSFPPSHFHSLYPFFLLSLFFLISSS